MRGGFLARRTRAGNPPPRRPSAATNITSDSPAVSPPSPAQDYPINVKFDYSDVLERTPTLIYRSDRRTDHSPYFGYIGQADGYPAVVFIDKDVELIRKAASWKAWKFPVVPPPEEERAFEMIAVQGKRPAIYARRDIKKGELIHKERPFLITPYISTTLDSIKLCSELYENAASRLHPDKRRVLLAYDNRYLHMTKYSGLNGSLFGNMNQVLVQSKPTEGSIPYQGAFETIPYIENSCGPSVNFTFEFQTMTGQIYAARDIKKGEMLTLPSETTGILECRAVRLASLWKFRRLVCQCHICSLPTAEAKASDDNRAFLREVREKRRLRTMGGPPVPLEELEKAIKLATIEQLPLELALLKSCRGAQTLELAPANPATFEMGIQWSREARDEFYMIEGPSSVGGRELAKLLGPFGDAARGYVLT